MTEVGELTETFLGHPNCLYIEVLNLKLLDSIASGVSSFTQRSIAQPQGTRAGPSKPSQGQTTSRFSSFEKVHLQFYFFYSLSLDKQMKAYY